MLLGLGLIILPLLEQLFLLKLFFLSLPPRFFLITLLLMLRLDLLIESDYGVLDRAGELTFNISDDFQDVLVGEDLDIPIFGLVD